MEEKSSLTKEEINELIKKIGSGDNAAWETLVRHYDLYLHKLARKRLQTIGVKNPETMEADLYSAGWIGFVSALKNYDDNKGFFTKYATFYIEGEMSNQLEFEFNSMGMTDMPERSSGASVTRVYAHVEDNEEENEANEAAFEKLIYRAVAKRSDTGFSVEGPEKQGAYSSERRALQIVDVLRLMTDEDHSLSSESLRDILTCYRSAKHSNFAPTEADNTFNKSMAEILLELDPAKHSDENDKDYRVKYEGYESDRLSSKVKMQKDNPNKVDTAPVINGLRYVHDFDKETLDKLIQLVSFSDMFSNEEKSQIINKLVKTGSVYYNTPFMENGDIRFIPAAIHGRFSQRNGAERKQLIENLKVIQKAINSLAQIRFRFNHYTADHKLVPNGEYTHVLSPYHMVVYHDNYYVIGLNQAWGDNRVLHYRVDLMSDIEIAKDDEGKIIPIKVCEFDGLPICNILWDPEKYMAEHINMAYGELEEIRIRIKETDYTLIHNWFGDHYEKVDSVVGVDEKGEAVNYDTVVVKTSPYMIVHWAMQYGTAVEILDEEIREKIREELKEMEKKYEKAKY